MSSRRRFAAPPSYAVRLPVTLLAVILLLPSLLLSACARSAPAAENDGTDGGMITGVFSASRISVPDGTAFVWRVVPCLDEETGDVTILVRASAEREENGAFIREYAAALVTFDSSGREVRREDVPLPEDVILPECGAVTADALYYTPNTSDNAALYRFDRRTGETICAGGENGSFFGREHFSHDFTASDANGAIYCADREEAVVLRPDLSPAFTVAFPSPVSSMARGTDGAVWVLFGQGSETRAARIDPETGTLGDAQPFARRDDVRRILIPALGGTGLFCCGDENALWAAEMGEDGVLREEKRIDFENSGIGKFLGLRSYASEVAGIYPAAVLSDTLVLAAESDGRLTAAPVLYRRTADIDPADIRTVTLAHAAPLSPAAVAMIRAFNAGHPDVKIGTADYSALNTNDDRSAGEKQLCFDMQNAGFRPDIVMTCTGQSAVVSEDGVIRRLTDRGLTVDLVPYIEQDDKVTFDALYGCIRRLFDYGRGGMWGIAPDFTAELLVMAPPYAAAYAGRTCWSAEEMLDFFDSLPADTEPYYLCTAMDGIWIRNLLCRGYGSFLEEDGTAFGSETFVRLLKWLKTLPEDTAAWRRQSPAAQMTQQERDAAFGNGGIAMKKVWFRAMSWSEPIQWYEEGWLPIGFASDGDSGIRIGTDSAYMITAWAEDPDLCFAIVRSFFTTEGYGLEYANGDSIPFFSLKPQFDEVMEKSVVARFFPPPSEEEKAWFFDLLDGAGVPYLRWTPEAVDSIAAEEIGAYLAGMGTAEDCAERIRSRVGIWLSERS